MINNVATDVCYKGNYVFLQYLLSLKPIGRKTNLQSYILNEE